ncbi:hypothetical protein, partial [Klebsiella pneumoniae]|uniref:hypothetical protein n=1 Tax=Klebsiella pneumoniae TaxID=573 RepID=UPI001C53295E
SVMLMILFFLLTQKSNATQGVSSAASDVYKRQEGEGTVRLAFKPVQAQRRRARYQARYP